MKTIYLLALLVLSNLGQCADAPKSPWSIEGQFQIVDLSQPVTNRLNGGGPSLSVENHSIAILQLAQKYRLTRGRVPKLFF